MDIRAGLLRLEVRRRRARDVERAVEVHVDHRAPFLDRHVEEEAVAQDAGVVHHRVDTPEIVERRLHDAIGRGPVGHTVAAGGRGAAGGANFLDHSLGRPGVRAFALDRGAEVVDQYFGAGRGHGEREVASDAATGAGDEHHLAFEHQSLKPG